MGEFAGKALLNHSRIPALKYVFKGIPGGFFIRKLAGEISSCLRVGARSEGLIFRIVEMAMGFLPVIPAFGMDMGAHLTVDEDGLGIFTPWTPQINGVRRTIALQPAILEYISEGFPFWCGSRCDIAAVDMLTGLCRCPLVFAHCRENNAIVKIGDGAAEDKVNISADIAVAVALSSHDAGFGFTGAFESAGLHFLFGKRRGKQSVLMA